MVGKKNTGCYENSFGRELIQSGVWCQNHDVVLASEKPLGFRAHMNQVGLSSTTLAWAAACCPGYL